ncbi:MAG: TIGR02677 family protein [Verrucomicrobiales bacterium]|nr:TIGR02677 family protein [Verrucomicrobiales bacterium]
MSEFSVFSHLTTAKTDLYRAALQAFATARSEFVIHLRPSEVAKVAGIEDAEIEPLLEQLAEWGNLERNRDHVDAVSIEDFYRTRYLYQLSGRGEAAERALVIFQESIDEPGELQTEALRNIIEYLEAIRRLVESGETDFSKLHQQFNHLNARFEEFTLQAQRFMQFLQSTIDLHGLSEVDFIDYKDRLIEYLQRFVRELVSSANEIAGKLIELERLGVHHCFEGVARQARADALVPDDAEKLAAERTRREGRWDGLKRWFIGDPDGHSQAETLRARAREAIPSLLTALQSFHDRRETGSDRNQDWRRLAQWFAEMPNDPMAHRLWRVAFAMGSSRHLRINEETLERRDQVDEGPRTSWLAAEPMWLEPRLRKSGRVTRTGLPPEIVDFSKEREALQRVAELENEQFAQAHAMLVTQGEMWLSDFSLLDSIAFDLLLDMLGQVVTAAGKAGESVAYPVEGTSTDGSLTIGLWPAREDGELARIETTNGTMTGRNYRVTIRLSDGLVVDPKLTELS